MSEAPKTTNLSKFEQVVSEKSVFLTNLVKSQRLADVMESFRKKLIRQNLAGIKNYVQTMIESYNRLAGKFDVDAKNIAMIGGLLNIYKNYAPFVAVVGTKPKSISQMLSLIMKQDFKSFDKKKIVLLALPLLAFNTIMTKLQNMPQPARYQVYNMMLDTSGVFAPTTINNPGVDSSIT